ncbi:hypothetical protein [Streptomyces sp. NBC_01216]|uniref:hypothetical protein n=1 Tax=unclassified Streptomyces TaxID=2593676 RepID=UPI002E153ABE|nr:hypothetical protein OG393_06520 [Streptomyces sp. NBC_01216]
MIVKKPHEAGARSEHAYLAAVASIGLGLALANYEERDPAGDGGSVTDAVHEV